MPTPTTALQRIAALKAEIESLKETAILNLKEKRVELVQELHDIDCEITRLNGKELNAPKKRAYRKASAGPTQALSLPELKELLAAAPGKTLNIRQANLDLQNIKTLAAENSVLLKIGGKGAWPTVTLLK